MIRFRMVALALLALAPAAACGDDDSGNDAVELTPKEPKPSVPEVPNDASTGEDVDSGSSATPIGAGFDAGSSDAAIDSSAEVPCPPVGTNPSTGARYAFAVPARLPKVLDGDLADFRRCVAIRLNASTAARVQGSSPAIADIYLEWEPDALWVGATLLTSG